MKSGLDAPRLIVEPIMKDYSQFTDAILEAVLKLPDDDYVVELKPVSRGQITRISILKSSGELILLRRSAKPKFAVGKVSNGKATPDDPLQSIEVGDELLCIDRDMSDVEAELHTSLKSNEFVRRLGLSRVTLFNYRLKGKIFGLKNGNRYVFPAWQLDRSGKLQPVVQEILETLKVVTTDPVDLLILMITGLDFFNGKSIKDFLIAGDTVSALQEARMVAKV